MRILLPIHSVYTAGGIGTMARGLVPALRAALGPGEQLVVASPREGSRGIVRALPGIGVPGGALARVAYEQLALPRLAKSCESVHLCDSRPILASRRPFVLTVHDVTYLDEPGWYAPAAATYKRLMLAAALAKVPAAVVCDSSFTRERLLAHHPRAAALDVRVVHPGLAEPPADRPPRRPEPYFLTVGTIEPRKNHLGLLEAFRVARARGLRLRWKVAGGDGHRCGPIRAALSAQDGVDVLGFVSDARLEELYSGALFVALSSHAEGFGYAPLEAMARGVPTVCSTGSGLDETAAGASMRVAASDVEAWARALLDLQDDEPRRAALVEAGRDRARRFAWEHTARQVLEIHRFQACASARSR